MAQGLSNHRACLQIGVRTFGYLDSYAWHRVSQWLVKRHKHLNWAQLYRRFLTGRPATVRQQMGLVMFDTTTVPITQHRWRATPYPHPMAQHEETAGSGVTAAIRGTSNAMKVARPVVCPVDDYVDYAFRVLGCGWWLGLRW